MESTQKKIQSEIKNIIYNSKKSIDLISIPYQRPLSNIHIARIVKTLKERKEKGIAYLEQPLVVNIRTNKEMVLLDGYHRLSALNKIDFDVFIKLEIYKELTEQEEKRLYQYYNVGKKHTGLDILRGIVEQYPLVLKLKNASLIPLTLYKNKKMGIPITTFIQYYFYIKYPNSKTNIIDYITILEEKDINQLIYFSEWYFNIAGIYNEKSNFYSTNMIRFIMETYFNNLTQIDILKERLKRFTFDSYLTQLLKAAGGYSAYRFFKKEALEQINKYVRNPLK